MTWADFCLGKAEECDLHGDAITDADARAEWRQMARDWRLAATRPGPPGARARKKPTRTSRFAQQHRDP